jgi:hypothetical protein
MRKTWLIGGGVLAAIGILYFSGVMAVNVFPYLGFEYAYGFLGTKTDAVLHKTHFQVAFYVHITSSMVVLVAGLGQFFPIILKKWPQWHRNIGKWYAGMILLLAAPSGLVLGFYANGGLAAKTGFVLQSVVWWTITALAWYEIRRKRPLQHVRMMFRSYAVTLAAMSLRTESYVMYYVFGTKPLETYLTVTWLSWVGNLLMVECLLYAGIAEKWIIIAQKTKQQELR